MNKLHILYITPGNPHIVTPETGFARDLAELGHKITFIYGTDSYPKEVLNGKYDIIMGAMEYSMAMANHLGKILNIPVYNHMEWVPPWRVGQSDPSEWGYEESTCDKISIAQIENFKNIYRQQVHDWENATIRSCAGKCLIKTIEPFVTKPVDCYVKYYAPNIEKMKQYINPNLKEKYQIMSTARLVPHKKIVHVVRALALIPKEIRPHYVVVGYGTELNQIRDEATKLGISIEFVGPGDKGLKERIIQESMFSVNIWAGIPIAESFYFDKPAISYNDEHMQEVFGDSVLYAERDNIQDLADKILFFINNPVERANWAKKGKELMMANSIGMGTPLRLALEVEAILYEGVNIWQKMKKI